MTRLHTYLSTPISPLEPVTRGMVAAVIAYSLVMFVLLVANFNWSSDVARQRDVARMQRDVARARVERVEAGCRVRPSDGHAECKPGTLSAPTSGAK